VATSYAPPHLILKDASFSLVEGSFHIHAGAAGSGKTTVFRSLYGSLRPMKGSVTVLGRDLVTMPTRELPALRREIGIIFQSDRFIEHLSTYDNVALPLRIAKREEKAIRKDVLDLLAWSGLRKRIDWPVQSLSSSQRRLVAAIRAVMGRPRLLLADDPSASMDPPTVSRLIVLLKEINRHGATLLVATQDPQLISEVGSSVLHLEAGRVQMLDAADQSSSLSSNAGRT
jgi:cell division transport system ATP-binding protein